LLSTSPRGGRTEARRFAGDGLDLVLDASNHGSRGKLS